MTLSKSIRKLFLIASLLISTVAIADDIDLFQGGEDVTGAKPNVLIIVDNSANWNSSSQGWADGLKQGQSELRALNYVLGSLTGDVRVGLMLFVKGTGSAKDGGYVRFGIRDMDTTNRGALQNILTGYSSGSIFNDESTGQQVATANSLYGEMMYEAYQYFSGSTSYAGPADLRDYAGNGSPAIAPYKAGSVSGNALSSSIATTYNTPLSTNAACAKNFIIFIGNGFPSNSSVNPKTTLGLADFNDTAIYDEGNKITYADEWTRYLQDKGAVAPCTTNADGNQVCADGKVTTFTINVFKDHEDTLETNLLKSMATVGGGEAFSATSEDAIKIALTNIFNQIQAVDSVFTSASLPVSVNTQGTYLNQIYMGVFRPDGGGKPRWLGNLKEYKFGLSTDASGNDTIFLADAAGDAAVNSTTGFLKSDAKSFWTYSTSPSAGFWAFKPTGDGGQYDYPDGDLVEKGAAAQKLRDLGPTDRTVYTCMPACTADATPALFKTTNATLVASLTGTDESVTLSRAGTTVTGTTTGDLLLNSPTDTVTISGANVAAYNGTWTATRLDATHFTFQITETPVTPATGTTMTVSSGSSVSQPVAAGAVTLSNGVVSVNLPSHGFVNNQSVTISGADVSSSMSTATTKCSSWTATTACEYNGTFTITVVDANNFTYTPPTGNYGTIDTITGTTLNPPDVITTPGTSAITCRNNSGSDGTVTNSSITRVSGSGSKLVKVTLSSLPTSCATTLTTAGSGNNGRILTIAIAGTGTSLDGAALTISGVGTSCAATAASSSDRVVCFNFTVTSANTTATTTIVPASPATGTIVATGLPTRTITSITRTDGTASNIETVTVTTASDHGFSSASSVLVAGADQTEYNGTKTTGSGGNNLAFPTSKTITYTLASGPTATSTGGTAAKGSTINASTLINWVRGVDNKNDENVNLSLTDVRASIHGDVLHSRPLVVNYGGSPTNIVAYYGTNDGIFHAVKVGDASADGTEKWAFVASEHYSTLGRLYNNSPLVKFPNTSTDITPTPTKRDYFFDGNIGSYQSSDLATTHIYVSMRRGGRFIYAFDVSNPDTPKFLWKKTNNDTGFSELGYTFSEPKSIPLKRASGVACRVSDPSTFTRALVFGAGYDPTVEDGTTGVVRTPTMGRGVFVLNAADGALITLLQPTDIATKYSVAADVTLMDSNGDGCVDRVYAVDTGGNILRYDHDTSDASTINWNWKTYKIAALGDVGHNGGSDDRKFLFPADVVRTTDSNVETNFLMVGSGNREDPLATTIADNFFMIKDTVQVGTDPSTVTATLFTDLTQVTDFNGTTSVINAFDSAFKGWYIAYQTGEKSVNAPLTVAGITFFGTNKPKPSDANQCTSNLGTARGYAINFLNGTSAVGDRNLDGAVNVTDAYTEFKGGGLPPSPVSGVVKIGDKFERFVIGGGCGTTGSTIEGCKVQANPSSNRTQVYWYFKKD